jgi:hypothetical protein
MTGISGWENTNIQALASEPFLGLSPHIRLSITDSCLRLQRQSKAVLMELRGASLIPHLTASSRANEGRVKGLSLIIELAMISHGQGMSYQLDTQCFDLE